MQQQLLPNDIPALIESYRYDALGRRVLTSTLRSFGGCAVAGCISSLQRTVWDGDQVLYDIRVRADSGATESTVENDAPGGNGRFGEPNAFGVVGYTHAGGLDHPIGAMRMSSGALLAAFYPHLNWRGQYAHASPNV